MQYLIVLGDLQNETTSVLRCASGTLTFIPCFPVNTDYQAYQAWVAAGNTAQPYTG